MSDCTQYKKEMKCSKPYACMWNTCRQSFCTSISTYSEDRTKRPPQHKGPACFIWILSVLSVKLWCRFSLTPNRLKNNPRSLQTDNPHFKVLAFKYKWSLTLPSVTHWTRKLTRRISSLCISWWVYTYHSHCLLKHLDILLLHHHSLW